MREARQAMRARCAHTAHRMFSRTPHACRTTAASLRNLALLTRMRAHAGRSIFLGCGRALRTTPRCAGCSRRRTTARPGPTTTSTSTKTLPRLSAAPRTSRSSAPRRATSSSMTRPRRARLRARAPAAARLGLHADVNRRRFRHSGFGVLAFDLNHAIPPGSASGVTSFQGMVMVDTEGYVVWYYDAGAQVLAFDVFPETHDVATNASSAARARRSRCCGPTGTSASSTCRRASATARCRRAGRSSTTSAGSRSRATASSPTPRRSCARAPAESTA